jgi:ribosomal protein L3 glutamine methyltransferase
MATSSSTVELQTIRDFIRWAASRMNEAGLHFGHGTEEALDEAATLVLATLHLPPDLHTDYHDCKLTAAEKEALVDVLSRRIEGRLPAAYIINEAWFAGLPFYVDERVVVPRSPIAELVVQRFYPWVDSPGAVTHILDLCAGSGCIGIACAKAFPNAQVDLAELSDDALEVAEINLIEHHLQDRVAALNSDLFSAIGGQRYDLIVSNPPYVSLDEYEGLPAEYGREPASGLLAGDDGLDVVARILDGAANFLSVDGVLVVEVGATWDAVARAWPSVPFQWLSLRAGGEGIFVLTREVLDRHRKDLRGRG